MSEMRVLVVLLIGLVISVNLTPLQAQQYFTGNPFIKNFKPEDFKGGIQSWSIIQDEKDVLYVANNFGVLEFDGATWKRYVVKGGTKVRSVLAGRNQKIYAGSQADFGYFQPDAKGRIRYISLLDSLPVSDRNLDEVWRIFEKGEETFFFTFKNIYKYKAGQPIKVIKPANPLEFAFQARKNIYVLQWGKGLSSFENDKLRLLPGGEFFADKQVASVLPFDKNQLLIFTIKDGIYLYDGARVSPFVVANQEALQGLLINQAILLKDGNFAIGTQNKGLLVIDSRGQVKMHTTVKQGLLDNTIHTLYQDVQENLWMGMNNGLAMLELSSPFSGLDGTMGIAGTGYAALQEGNQLYLGTNSGLFVSDAGQQSKSFTLVPNSTGQVYHLDRVAGQLLMAHHNGPFVIRNNAAESIYPEKGAWQFLQVPQHPDKTIVGTYTGISLLAHAGPEFSFLKKFKGLDESSRVLEFDRNGELWMAHGYKGLFRIKFDPALQEIKSVKFYNSKQGLPSDQLINMERIRGELVFPALHGIYRFNAKTDRFVLDKELSSLFYPKEHIIEMEEDIQGNIYFVSDHRVGRLSFDRFGKATLEDKLFNSIRDQLNDDLSFIHVLDLNNVLFGAKEGFIHYNAVRPKKMLPFHTRIAEVRIKGEDSTDSLLLTGRAFEKPNHIELPFAFNSLQFIYASAFYERPERTQFQYFLENFDTGWSGWSNKTDKEYTNLPEGRYVFHVRAKNIYGATSEAKSFEFVIKPPFYRSKSAFLVYLLAGGLLLGFSFFQVDKRFKKEKRRLILEKERRISQKEIQIREITNQSEQEIDRLKSEKLQAEIDHMNRELTYSTIHLINKNELLSSVKSELQGILKKNGKANTGEELKKIIHDIDQNITSEVDWKQFELHFTHVHGDFIHRLQERFPNLTPQEIKLSTYLRLNLTTKDIAQLLNISVRGVEISRYRLRKRLELERSENLTDFMLKF